MEFKKRYLISLIVRSVGLLLGFTLSILIARATGTEGLGLYSLFLVHLTLLVTLTKFGQDTLMVREASRLSTVEARYQWFKASLLIVMRLSIVFGGSYLVLMILGLITFSGSSEVTQVSLLMLIALLAQVFVKHYLAYLRANNLTTQANVFDGPLQNAVLIAFIGVIVFTTSVSDSLYPVYGLVFATIVQFTIAIAAIRLHSKKVSSGEMSVGPNLKAGVPFLLVGMSATLNTSVDTLSIGHMLDAEQLGLYSAPLKLAALIAFPLVIASTVVSNQFSRLFHQQQLDSLRALLLKVNLAVGGLSLFIFVAFLLLGEWLLSLWSPEFVNVHNVLLILSFGQVINALFGPLGMLLNMVGREKAVLVMTLVSVFTNIVLNYLLIARYGITGAAIATAVVVVMQNIGFLVLSRSIWWPGQRTHFKK